jgi:hypothetical protein
MYGLALHCHLQGAILLSSRDAQLRIAMHHATRHNTSINNIPLTAPQLSFAQKALGALSKDGSVMLKHVG